MFLYFTLIILALHRHKDAENATGEQIIADDPENQVSTAQRTNDVFY